MSQLKTIVQSIHQQMHDRVIFGHSEQLYHLLVAYFANGHVLLEGPPGTAKTLTARCLAKLLGRNFKRIQFTTDMLPSDILGAHIFNPKKNDFDFIQGPIFSDFIVADEINRTPPRTQSALLEAMEERQVTTEGTRHALDEHFFVIATQNPQDFEGTFPLPEVQLDRFLFKLVVDHADAAVEKTTLQSLLKNPVDVTEALNPVRIERGLLDAEISSVQVDEAILGYITQILAATREHPMLSAGSSLRGGIAIARAARVLALIEGRNTVTPDDVKTLAPLTLRHRIRLSAEAQVSHYREGDVIGEILEKVGFPK